MTKKKATLNTHWTPTSTPQLVHRTSDRISPTTETESLKQFGHFLFIEDSPLTTSIVWLGPEAVIGSVPIVECITGLLTAVRLKQILRDFGLPSGMAYHLSRTDIQLDDRVGLTMKPIIILATAIAASTLTFLISRHVARFTNRKVILLAVAAFGLYGVFLVLMPKSWILMNIFVVSVAGVVGSGLGLFLKTKPSFWV
jgi:hypothetical protein